MSYIALDDASHSTYLYWFCYVIMEREADLFADEA